MSFCLGINQPGNNVARIQGRRVGGVEFWAGAFGDLRNQVDPSSSPWECPTFGQEQTGKNSNTETAQFSVLSLCKILFSVLFLRLTSVKVLIITKLILL